MSTHYPLKHSFLTNYNMLRETKRFKRIPLSPKQWSTQQQKRALPESVGVVFPCRRLLPMMPILSMTPSLSSFTRFLYPITTPLVFFLVIIPITSFLPFVTIFYSMHSVSLVQVYTHRMEHTPIVVGSEIIQANTMLFPCLGGICSQDKELIQQNLKLLLDAGNTSQNDLGQSSAATSTVEAFFNTMTIWLASIFRTDADNMRNDEQVQLFAWAGVLVVLLLLLAGVLSAAAILIHTINIIQRGSDELKSIVESFNDAIGWILAFASLLFPAMTWTQPKKYQAGFIIMLLCSIGLNCSCVGRALARWVRKNMWRCHVEKSSKSQPQSVVEYEVQTELN